MAFRCCSIVTTQLGFQSRYLQQLGPGGKLRVSLASRPHLSLKFVFPRITSILIRTLGFEKETFLLKKQQQQQQPSLLVHENIMRHTLYHLPERFSFVRSHLKCTL